MSCWRSWERPSAINKGIKPSQEKEQQAVAYPRALTPAKEKAIATAYSKGKSSFELSQKHGVHRSTIVGIVRRAGMPVRRPGGPLKTK